MEISRFIERKARHKWDVHHPGIWPCPTWSRTRPSGTWRPGGSVEVLFGKIDWVERLVDLAGSHPIRNRPTEDSIEAEVLAIMPELAPAPVPMTPQVVIQNVEHLHIHVGPEAIGGLTDLTAEG